MPKKILDINNLVVQFPVSDGYYFNAVKGISFHINEGEVVGLVGESGSGKSTTARAIMGLVDHSSGSVKINGDLVPNKTKRIKGSVATWLATKVQMIFQDAKSSLNPREKVFDIIVEGAKNQNLYEKNKDEVVVNLVKKWLEENRMEFGESIFFRYTEAKWENKLRNFHAQLTFDQEHAKIHDEYLTQKFICDGIKSECKTKIRSLRTEYKIALKQEWKITELKEELGDKLNQYLVYKKKGISENYPLPTNLKVKDVLKAKYIFDVGHIKGECEAKFKVEEQKLADMLESYKTSKAHLTKEFHHKKSEFNSKWEVFKKEHELEFKTEQKDQGTKSYEAKKSFDNLMAHSDKQLNKREFYRDIVNQAMNAVSISPEFVNRYPGEFSGGQAQRIAIARTIAMKSDLIIADEPISALDVSIQAQVINLLKKLIKDNNLTIMFIAHDLQVVRYISDRIVVMYKGEVVEQGNAQEVYNNPVHPYTQSLVNAVPSIDHPERLRNSKAYKATDFEGFLNFGEIEKRWAKVSDTHMVYGQPKNTKKWIAEAKKK